MLIPVVGPLRWASLVVLVGLAVTGALKAVRRYRAHRLGGIRQDVPVGARTAYVGMLGMTLLSPMTVIYFAALVLGGSGTAADPHTAERVVFVVAAFVASASWQLLLAGGGALLGRALTGRVGRLLTAIGSSVVIVVLAVRLVA
jgi:arginine exporter protein ArgO